MRGREGRVNPRTDESLEILRRMVALPATAVLVERLEILRSRVGVLPYPYSSSVSGFRSLADRVVSEEDIEHTIEQLELANYRDLLQTWRPEGCWCLGVGGRGTSILPPQTPFPQEFIFDEFCSCGEGVEEQERVAAARWERNAAALEYRLYRHWVLNMPKRFHAVRLETSPLRNWGMGRLIEQMTMERPRRSWFFWGENGRGKTGLAVGYAWEWLHAVQAPLYFTTMPDLLAELRASYGSDEAEQGETEANIVGRLATVGLLILDDLGAEQVREQGDGSWVADRLFQIVGKRHAEELPTLFTSNLSLEQLERRIGKRLAERIREMCGRDHIIKVEGPNLRQGG